MAYQSSFVDRFVASSVVAWGGRGAVQRQAATGTVSGGARSRWGGVSRRARWVAGAVAAAALVAAPAAAGDDWWTLNDDRIVIHGGGYGHGRGMSQWGAQGAALQGKSYRDILGFYYPGATVGSTAEHFNRWIRVRLDNQEIGSWVRLAADGGTLSVRDTVTGQRVTLSDAPYFRVWRGGDGKWVVQTTDARTTATDVLTLTGNAQFSSTSGVVKVVSPDAVSTSYRGEVVTVPEGDTIVPVNHVSMLDYLASVVSAESIASWRPAALEAQAVAARTFAVYRATKERRAEYYDVCATVACQVYRGVSTEHPATTAAVQHTAGELLVYRGSPALTMFSSSNGGHSVSYSAYTEGRPDPYDATEGNRNHRWTKEISPQQLKNKWPQLGEPLYVEVLERDGSGPWGGRVTKVRIRGTAGDVTASGDQVRWAAGLRSTLAASSTSGIVAAWQASGGRHGYLGDMTSGETMRFGVRFQAFERGQIVWSPVGGSRILFGGLGAVYWGSGGVEQFGPPVSNEYNVAGGRRQDFGAASGIWSSGNGAHMLYGAIRATYDAAGGPATFGMPISGEYNSPDGRAQDFTGGRLVWNRITHQVAWHQD